MLNRLKTMVLATISLTIMLPLEAPAQTSPVTTQNDHGVTPSVTSGLPLIGSLTHNHVPVPPLSPEEQEKKAVSDSLYAQGLDALHHHKPMEAISYFQSLISIQPGMAKSLGLWIGQANVEIACWPEAVRWYRTSLYGQGQNGELVPEGPWGSPDILLNYTLALLRTGNAQEAVSVFNKAANEVNYVDGKQNNLVLIPLWDIHTRGYSPRRLEALTHTAISAYLLNWDVMLPNVDAAIKLDPDLAEAHYYRAVALGTTIHANEAIKEYQQAILLGDDAVQAVSRKALDSWPLKSISETRAEK